MRFSLFLAASVFVAVASTAQAAEPDRLVEACKVLLAGVKNAPAIGAIDRSQRLVTLHVPTAKEPDGTIQCQFLNETDAVPELVSLKMGDFVNGETTVAGVVDLQSWNKAIWNHFTGN